jgi:hypothetical protein
MPLTLDGAGTIGGLAAGGLPDNSITTAEIAANAVTTAKLGTNEASGLCKAWVNFNGSGVVAIRSSYNVSSITDNGTGNYTVNFTTPMSDTNYAVVGGVGQQTFAATPEYGTTKAVGSFLIITAAVVAISGDNRTVADNSNICVAVFR